VTDDSNTVNASVCLTALDRDKMPTLHCVCTAGVMHLAHDVAHYAVKQQAVGR
jgi:hypothetical protein